MVVQNRYPMVYFFENQIQEEFDKDVRRTVIGMASLREMLVKSHELNEEGNILFKARACRAISRYDKALQYPCLAITKKDEDANLMEKLGISINLNIATYSLKSKEFELAK